MQLWQTLSCLIRDHGRCAMVTIIETKGSAPREAGARLFVIEDGGYRGTIGGGALEWRAIAEAQGALSRQSWDMKVSSAVLGPDLGQCCGGQVRMLTEIFTSSDLDWIGDFACRESSAPFSTELSLSDAKVKRRIVEHGGRAGAVRIANGNVLYETFGEDRRTILLFGAGHVGRALVLALAPLPFAVSWIDSRPQSFPSALPAAVTPLLAENPAALLDLSAMGSFVVVMTHSHAMDFDIVLRAFQLDKFGYIGLIGSETKRARFISRLRAAGINDSKSNSLVCPIGMSGIKSKHPAVIAASTAAELIARDEQLRLSAHPVPAARRIA
jgi:xanthine dehydrogenase accessory factor